MKNAILGLIIAGLMVGCGASDGDGDGGVPPEDKKPDVYGYNYISIYNNYDPNNYITENIQDSHLNNDISVMIGIRVHCTDYQYRDSDLISRMTVNGVTMLQYVIGNDLCTEQNLDSSNPAYGSKTIVTAKR